MDPKKILVSASIVLLVVFATSGAILMVKNSKSGPAGLLNSLGGIFGGNHKSVGKVGSGRVMAIDGDTITIQGTITTTYKINTSGIKVTKGFGSNIQDISASDIKTGDIIQISGTVADNPVSVDSIVDNGNSPTPFSFQGINGLRNISNIHPASGTSSNINPSSLPASMPNISNLLKGIKTK